jgi:hypothetical protein
MVGAETDPRSKLREEQHRLRQATAAKKERPCELHWREAADPKPVQERKLKPRRIKLLAQLK